MIATALPLWLLQAAPDPAGPGQWNLRNWAGLGCQVVVFILLVAFIFWLADLKNAGDPDPEDGAGGEAAPVESAPDPEPESLTPSADSPAAP